MLKAQRDFSNIKVRVGRNTVNSGKARTVCNALQHSTAELMISIDSDCIFHPEAIRELAACFSEPKIGSVGGRVGVRNPNENAITAIQTFIYYAAFQVYKVPENWTRSIGCISGCLFAIRDGRFVSEPIVDVKDVEMPLRQSDLGVFDRPPGCQEQVHLLGFQRQASY